MNRWFGLLNVVQALGYIGLGAYFQPRWLPAALLLWALAGAQLVGGGLLLGKRGDTGVRWASIASLVGCLFLLGLHVQVGVHIINTFTPIGAEKGWTVMGGALALVPWMLFIPLAQLIATRPGKAAASATAAAALVGLVLPGLLTHSATQPDQIWPQQDVQAGAEWAWQQWKSPDDTPPPTGDEVHLAVTVVRDGVVLEVNAASGPFDQALRGALPTQEAWHDDAGLTLEVVRQTTPTHRTPLGPQRGEMVPPGNTGFLKGGKLKPSVQVWKKVTHRRALDTLTVPTPAREGAAHWTTGDAWMVSESGSTAMLAGWSAPEPMTPENLVDSAVAGAHWMHINMQPDGKFAYIVEGPSGKYGRGYNYPRHAGSSWFLARVYTRTGDEKAKEAALAAIGHAKRTSKWTEDGRAFVHDPARRDGQAWVGTTALQLLALLELDVEPELAQAYTNYVASAVDERGSVRGNMDVATQSWPVQDEVTYAQGQGLLALIAAERAGLDVKAELDRAIAYVDDGYWPAPATRMGILDEHWMCLATVAALETRGVPAGLEVCTAYLADVVGQAPVGGALNPPAGPAGGLAEAVIARAEVDRVLGVEGPYMERSLDYGELLLAQQYRSTDTPMLGNSLRLIGAYRDRPWALKVQVDAVQHVGCALMGIEQLLVGKELPGAMP